MTIIGLAKYFDADGHDRYKMTVSLGNVRYNLNITKEAHDSLVNIGLRKDERK